MKKMTPDEKYTDISEVMFTTMPALGCAIYRPTEEAWIWDLISSIYVINLIRLLSSTNMLNKIYMSKFVREGTSQKWQGHGKEDMVLTIADMDLPIFPSIKKAILKQLEMTNNFTYKVRSKQYF